MMPNRRDFLAASAATAAGFALSPFAFGQEPKKEGRKKLAVVTTLWNYRSHAWHMAERFLGGYPLKGKWHRPQFDVVSAYVDQKPEGDLSAKRAAESGFKSAYTISLTRLEQSCLERQGTSRRLDADRQRRHLRLHV